MHLAAECAAGNIPVRDDVRLPPADFCCGKVFDKAAVQNPFTDIQQLGFFFECGTDFPMLIRRFPDSFFRGFDQIGNAVIICLIDDAVFSDIRLCLRTGHVFQRFPLKDNANAVTQSVCGSQQR